MVFKVVAVRNGREIVSDSTFHDKALADSYRDQAIRMGCQQAKVIEVDDIEARKMRRAKAMGIM